MGSSSPDDDEALLNVLGVRGDEVDVGVDGVRPPPTLGIINKDPGGLVILWFIFIGELLNCVA